MTQFQQVKIPTVSVEGDIGQLCGAGHNRQINTEAGKITPTHPKHAVVLDKLAAFGRDARGKGGDAVFGPEGTLVRPRPSPFPLPPWIAYFDQLGVQKFYSV